MTLCRSTNDIYMKNVKNNLNSTYYMGSEDI